MDLRGVGELHHPHGHRHVARHRAARHALAVPARERVREGLPDPRIETQALRDLARERAVREEDALDLPPTTRREAGGDPHPRRRGAVGPGTTEHVEHHRELRRPDVVHAGAERDVVAEGLRQLERLAGADGGEQRDPVRLGASGLVQAEAVGQAQGDQARAEDVLHRLTDAEVRGERQDGDELRQAHIASGASLCAGPCRSGRVEDRTTHDTTPESRAAFGGDDRTRTDDPLLAKQVLYQLSYVPEAIACQCSHGGDRR